MIDDVIDAYDVVVTKELRKSRSSAGRSFVCEISA